MDIMPLQYEAIRNLKVQFEKDIAFILSLKKRESLMMEFKFEFGDKEKISCRIEPERFHQLSGAFIIVSRISSLEMAYDMMEWIVERTGLKVNELTIEGERRQIDFTFGAARHFFGTPYLTLRCWLSEESCVFEKVGTEEVPIYKIRCD